MADWQPNPEAWRDFFPPQECPACGLEHPGQPCPQPDLLEEVSREHPNH